MNDYEFAKYLSKLCAEHFENKVKDFNFYGDDLEEHINELISDARDEIYDVCESLSNEIDYKLNNFDEQTAKDLYCSNMRCDLAYEYQKEMEVENEYIWENPNC